MITTNLSWFVVSSCVLHKITDAPIKEYGDCIRIFTLDCLKTVIALENDHAHWLLYFGWSDFHTVFLNFWTSQTSSCSQNFLTKSSRHRATLLYGWKILAIKHIYSYCLAPIKKIAIPRLKFCGAVLLSKLDKSIVNSLQNIRHNFGQTLSSF